MDDDAPLSKLKNVNIKPPAVDDNMTLAALARAKPKADTNGKSAGGKPKAGKGKGKAKGVAKKKEERQSSSSDSSSSSSSDSSDEGEQGEGDQGENKKAKAKATKTQRMALLKRERDGPDEDADEEEKKDNLVKKRDRTPKQQVVADLLSRWWYALPDWPPEDQEFYKQKLEEIKLRQAEVTIQEWEWVPEEDERGFKKVYQLSQFRGVFRNSSGEMIDLRPQETCPCFQNFMKKDLPELYDLLVKAYEGQLKDLANSKYNEERFRKELETTLTKTRNKMYEAKKIAGPKRSRTA